MIQRFLAGPMPASFTEFSLFLLRVTSGLLMMGLHGLKKTPPPEKFIEGVAALGFPLPTLFAWCASLAETGGGFLLALGLLTRPSAFFVAFTMSVAAFGRHLNDPFDRKELSLLYLAISLFFFFYGAGRLSLDHYIWGSSKPSR